MYYALIVIMLMVSAIIAIHLGLVEAVMKVVIKVAKCHKCLTFWSSLCVLLFTNCNIVLALLLSLLGAYLSNWFVLLFIELTKEYDKLWQRLNKKERG